MTELELLRERIASLEAQLAAATNDAARAELRARDLKREGDILAPIVKGAGWKLRAEEWNRLTATPPDSDARLREVMEAAWEKGRTCRGVVDRARDIDEVLGVKP